MAKQAKIIGIRIECPKQLPIRNIPRKDYAIGSIKGERRYYVVKCDCGSIHRIRTARFNKLPKHLTK